MQKLIFLGALLFPTFLWAQTKPKYSHKPPYYYYKKIPPFSMNMANGSTFSEKDIDANKPVLLVLFSVTCHYCDEEIKNITAHINQFKNAEIVMVTPFPKNEMANYYYESAVRFYPKIIKMGSDTTKRLNGFFEQEFYPGLYIFSKKGHNIIYHHEGTAPVDTLLYYLKQ